MNIKEADIEKERIKLIKEAEESLTDEQKEYLNLFKPLMKPESPNVVVHISTEGTTCANEK